MKKIIVPLNFKIIFKEIPKKLIFDFKKYHFATIIFDKQKKTPLQTYFLIIIMWQFSKK